jgi:hypothetical protein
MNPSTIRKFCRQRAIGANGPVGNTSPPSCASHDIGSDALDKKGKPQWLQRNRPLTTQVGGGRWAIALTGV